MAAIGSPAAANLGPFCVVILITHLVWAFGDVWKKLDMYEKRISQLEEQVKTQFVEKVMREGMSTRRGNESKDHYYTPE